LSHQKLSLKSSSMGLSGEASSLPYQLGELVASAELKRWIGVNPILPQCQQI